ncbi:recombinase family protein, partial [Nocardiopsis composta]|uniref:recombinase family protein n=1 Tax=Nocardiopsis composta TaxID=157465 RepID=UPI0031CE630D
CHRTPKRWFRASKEPGTRHPQRGFDAVVVGEPQRVFYDAQFNDTFPLFKHYDVPLWVPEVGGPIDSRNEAHTMILSVFGGTSKGERTRIQVRVQAAMAAQAQYEGRWLGGRPPYGYMLADAGPHPNPAKAADGKRLHRLVPNPDTDWVVRLIYGLFLTGWGIGAIAEHLTAEGIPSPSAYDRRRNPHRSGVAWAKAAVRVILTNLRYTGHQVWNKQRKDEVLLDVRDVSLGYTTKQRWNERDKWVISDEIVHEPLIPRKVFDQVQQILAGRGRGPTQHAPRRSPRPYVLKGRFMCGVCDRRMQGNWNNDQAYYRCRFPQEYALANKIDHPRVVYVREADVLPRLDGWISTVLAPARLHNTIDALVQAQEAEHDDALADVARRKIAGCDAKLARYRAALDAGADPVTVTQWINTATAERVRAEREMQSAFRLRRLTREEIAEMVDGIADLSEVVAVADPKDKAELYEKMGLRLTYHCETRTVEARIEPDLHRMCQRLVSEGGLEPPCP